MDRRTELGFGRSLKFVPKLTADAGWGRGLGACSDSPNLSLFCSVVNFSPTCLSASGARGTQDLGGDPYFLNHPKISAKNRIIGSLLDTADVNIFQTIFEISFF